MAWAYYDREGSVLDILSMQTFRAYCVEIQTGSHVINLRRHLLVLDIDFPLAINVPV